MRAQNVAAKMATSFLGEPIKSYNMLRNAFSSTGTTRQKGLAITRAMIAFVASQTAAAAAAAVVDAFRRAGADDDDDGIEDTWLERWANAFGANMANNMNPLNMIPYVREVWSLAEGFAAARLDLQAAERFFAVAGNAIGGKNQWSAYKTIYELVRSLSAFTGIGVGNLMRDFNGIYNTISGEDIDMVSETATSGKSYATMYEAIVDGDTDKAQRIRDFLANDKDSPKSAKDIDIGIARELMENDARIAQAYKAKADSDIDKMKQLRRQVMASGFSDAMFTKAVNLYENSLAGKEDKDLTETLDVAMFDYDDLYSAIRAGASDSEIDEIRQDLVTHSDAKDPEDAVRKAVAGEFRPEYIAAVNNGNTKEAERIAKKLAPFGVDDEKLAKWVIEDKGTKMRDAVRAGDVQEANAFIEEQIALGRTDKSIKDSIRPLAKDLVYEAYEADGWAGVDRYLYLLRQLKVYNTTKDSYYYGQPYFYEDMVYGWVYDYLEEQGSISE